MVSVDPFRKFQVPFLLLPLDQISSKCECEYAILEENSSDHTGKSFSEAFIHISTNQQYDKILFIGLPVQYMKTKSSEHVVYTNCFLF